MFDFIDSYLINRNDMVIYGAAAMIVSLKSIISKEQRLTINILQTFLSLPKSASRRSLFERWINSPLTIQQKWRCATLTSRHWLPIDYHLGDHHTLEDQSSSLRMPKWTFFGLRLDWQRMKYRSIDETDHFVSLGDRRSIRNTRGQCRSVGDPHSIVLSCWDSLVVDRCVRSSLGKTAYLWSSCRVCHAKMELSNTNDQLWTRWFRQPRRIPNQKKQFSETIVSVEVGVIHLCECLEDCDELRMWEKRRKRAWRNR